jgi:hypothetical protein
MRTLSQSRYLSLAAGIISLLVRREYIREDWEANLKFLAVTFDDAITTEAACTAHSRKANRDRR